MQVISEIKTIILHALTQVDKQISLRFIFFLLHHHV